MCFDAQLNDWWNEAQDLARDAAAEVVYTRSVALDDQTTLVTLGDDHSQQYQALLKYVQPSLVVMWAEVHNTARAQFDVFPYHLMLGPKRRLAVSLGAGGGATRAEPPE